MRVMTTTKNVYPFNELSPEAQEEAIESFREGHLDYDWREFVYDDVESAAKILGIELTQKPVRLMNGTTRYDPSIWFSGFYHQGSGSCFNGSYSYAKGATKAIKAEFPGHKELHRIAHNLQDAQSREFYNLTATIKGNDRYHTLDIEVYRKDDQYRDLLEGSEDGITEALRDFNHWIYKSLENEYEYLMSDDSIKETILANEYEFTENGKLI